MKALRLTAHDRAAIVIALVSHGTTQESQEITKERLRIADMAYNELFTASDQKRMDGLPKGWLRETTTIHLGSPCYTQVSLGEQRRITDASVEDGYSYTAKLKAPSPALAKAVEEVQRRDNALRATKELLEQQIKATLVPLTTWAKFKASWPEAYEAVQHLEPAQPDNLPMIIPATLNEALQLGKKKTSLAIAA